MRRGKTCPESHFQNGQGASLGGLVPLGPGDVTPQTCLPHKPGA